MRSSRQRMASTGRWNGARCNRRTRRSWHPARATSTLNSAAWCATISLRTRCNRWMRRQSDDCCGQYTPCHRDTIGWISPNVSCVMKNSLSIAVRSATTRCCGVVSRFQHCWLASNRRAKSLSCATTTCSAPTACTAAACCGRWTGSTAPWRAPGMTSPWWCTATTCWNPTQTHCCTVIWAAPRWTMSASGCFGMAVSIATWNCSGTWRWKRPCWRRMPWQNDPQRCSACWKDSGSCREYS